MRNQGGFRHYGHLKMIAAIGVIVAIFVPSFAKYLGQYESGSLHWWRFSAFLVVTSLFVFLAFKLIRFIVTRDTVTKEQRKEIEQEERCIALREQAYASCRSASGVEVGHNATWKKPKNAMVQQAIWGPHPAEGPLLLEILLDAWEAGDRDTELALQLMYASWDLWEWDFAYPTTRDRKLDGDELIVGFQQPYEYLGGHRSENHILLLTAGHMISLFFYRTGLTFEDAEMCLQRFLTICPEGIPEAEFEGRGALGDYYSHIIGYRNRQ